MGVVSTLLVCCELVMVFQRRSCPAEESQSSRSLQAAASEGNSTYFHPVRFLAWATAEEACFHIADVLLFVLVNVRAVEA